MTDPERLPPPPFWRTRYFAMSVIARQDRRMIDPIMIKSVRNTPHDKEEEASGRVRYWGYIAELGHWPRVVTLADGETVHNAMLDRDCVP